MYMYVSVGKKNKRGDSELLDRNQEYVHVHASPSTCTHV